MARAPRRPPEEWVAATNTRIAELFGYDPAVFTDDRRTQVAGQCPIRGAECDVTENRHRTAHLNILHQGIAPRERQTLQRLYGRAALPLGICSCWTKRQNETVARPWILCPKRLLVLEPPRPVIPIEVKSAIGIADGTRVRVWAGLKFRSRETGTSRFFEYTFDYLLLPLDNTNNPVGPPYIIEVMTSSTRGGGLTEHMVDVLLGRPQRNLREAVQSIYSPNYRQVFERMLGQFVAKSEIAEHWGGRTVWVVQDVLLDYIEQTTAFDSNRLRGQQNGNVYVEVYGLERPAAGINDGRMALIHTQSLRGRARASLDAPDFTSMLGLGYAPSLGLLIASLRRGQARRADTEVTGRCFDFTWGETADNPTRA